MKTLYTSYYARSGKRPGAICISAKAPFFYKGPAMYTLAPSWDLLRAYKDGKIDAYGYTEWFGRLLKERGLTPQAVVNHSMRVQRCCVMKRWGTSVTATSLPSG